LSIGVILVAVGDVESAPSAEVGENLGSRLRQARQRSGMTLREVARQLGVSASFVSQLENGKSQPSVVTLYSLTQLLGVSIDEMFELERQPEDVQVPAPRGDGQSSAARGARGGTGSAKPRGNGGPISRTDLGSPADAWPQQESRPHWALTRPGSRPKLVMDSGVIWEQLAPNTGRYLDFMEITYPPGSSSTNDDHMLRHVGFEFGYLLEGELQVTCGFEVFTVRAGEALGMDSSVPHLLKNLGSVPARGIWCVHHEHA
jgi:transcriptional regulator with XRE-family HTH domain/mannose-6-phosphate isomerase-like protein (cupin superfamily)